MGHAGTCAPAEERTGVITFKSKPVTLVGPEIKAGSKAPDFEVVAIDGTPATLATFAGKPLVISVTPSLDTGLCDTMAKRFNEEASKLPGVQVIDISMDLPAAQKRWCGAANADKIKTFSDHRRASFGKAYGVLMKEMRLLARSVFVVDASGTVKYAEYVPEGTTLPNFDAAVAAAKQVAK